MKAHWLSISAAAVLALSAAQANAEEGLELAKKSGCLACHSVEKKVVGPAWQDVSNKYKGDAGAKARLVEKVKKGGKGNSTEVTGGGPMPPYSPRVSDADIEKLVDFVLSLAKKQRQISLLLSHQRAARRAFFCATSCGSSAAIQTRSATLQVNVVTEDLTMTTRTKLAIFVLLLICAGSAYAGHGHDRDRDDRRDADRDRYGDYARVLAPRHRHGFDDG